MESLTTLLKPLQETRGDVLTPELRRLYGGPLTLPPAPRNRPITLVNFVTTLEGITSFSLPGQEGGGEVSGFNEQDKFVMGMLRALSDAVVVGANTIRKEHEHLWTPQFISPEYAKHFRVLRQKMDKKKENPLNMFVTGSGNVLSSAGKSPKQLPAVFANRDVETWIITTSAGEKVARTQFAGAFTPRIMSFGDSRTVDLKQMMRYLRHELGIQILLVEGGAAFNGAVVDAELYDELLLTRSPFIIGTAKERPRPLCVSGFERTPAEKITHTLVSVKSSGNYLYLRYRRK